MNMSAIRGNVRIGREWEDDAEFSEIGQGRQWRNGEFLDEIEEVDNLGFEGFAGVRASAGARAGEGGAPASRLAPLPSQKTVRGGVKVAAEVPEQWRLHPRYNGERRR